MEKIATTVLAKADIELLDYLKHNATEGFNMLYRKYWQQMIAYASIYLPDKSDCEEIVQDFFVHLYTRRNDIFIKSSLSAYLKTSLRNRIFNHLRNESVYKKHIGVVGTKKQEYNDVEHKVVEADLKKNIKDCLSYMPQRYRQVFILNRQEYFTLKEISQKLNVPVNTIEKQLRKSIALLKGYLGQN